MFKWLKYLAALPSILALISQLLGLIRSAEDLLAGGGRGAEKKAMVLQLLGAAVDLGQRLGIPGANTINRASLQAAASTVIDALVQVLNLSGVFKHGGPSPAGS